MGTVSKLKSNHAGQVLLLSVCLGLVLLIGVSAVFFMTQTGSNHQVFSSQRGSAASVADAGLGYAMQQLGQSLPVWQSALNANFLSIPVCNSGALVKTPSGGHFTISCSTGTAGNPNLQNYEVAVKVVASQTASGGVEMPLRAIQAYVGQRTLGADLASRLHTAAALQLVMQPNVAGTLDVEWGPIVCLDPNPWLLPNVRLDAAQYPRKFSAGWIYGTSFPRSGPGGPGPQTDQQEYWSQSAFIEIPLVDKTYYRLQAQAESGIGQPVSKQTGSPITPACAGPTACGYFGPPNLAPGDTAVFGAASLYSLTRGQILYIDGNAEFDKIAMDGASVLVLGQMTLADSSGGNILTLNVPQTAPLEYPHFPSNPTSWPCQVNPVPLGYTCTSPGKVQFRGFLYVEGQLLVNAPDWTMAGALWVGKLQAPYQTSLSLTIPSGNGLTLYYDDQINHSLHFNPVGATAIKLVPDFQQDIVAN
jgi:hypothetical protein